MGSKFEPCDRDSTGNRTSVTIIRIVTPTPQPTFYRSLYLILALLVLLPTCRKFSPPPGAHVRPFMDRAKTETKGDITVSAGIPSQEESIQIFGVDLYANGMQPLWIQVKNYSKNALTLLPSSIDPEYYSPNEASYITKAGYSSKGQWDRDIFFQKMSMPYYIPPQSEASGYIWTHVANVTKYFNVDFFSVDGLTRFNFLMELPYDRKKYVDVDFDTLYPPEEIKDVSLEELRAELKNLPCCVPSAPKDVKGDPINLILIGDDEETLSALVRSGWKTNELFVNPIQSMDPALSKRPYSYNLVTTLYLFDRTQDKGFYKQRQGFKERNQIWVWLSPWRYQGKRVWVASLTRDIGLRYLTQPYGVVITHKIDPDVDETREYILENMISVNSVKKVGWVKGVGGSTPTNPKPDYLGDHWYSDGLRLVLFISDKAVDVNEIELLDWDFPPTRDPVRAPSRN